MANRDDKAASPGRRAVLTGTGLAAAGFASSARAAAPPPTESRLIKQVVHNPDKAPGATNALIDVLHITPTSLDAGLRALCDQQPEQLPTDGVGTLKRKRFWADIDNSSYSPEILFGIPQDDGTVSGGLSIPNGLSILTGGSPDATVPALEAGSNFWPHHSRRERRGNKFIDRTPPPTTGTRDNRNR